MAYLYFAQYVTSVYWHSTVTSSCAELVQYMKLLMQQQFDRWCAELVWLQSFLNNITSRTIISTHFSWQNTGEFQHLLQHFDCSWHQRVILVQRYQCNNLPSDSTTHIGLDLSGRPQQPCLSWEQRLLAWSYSGSSVFPSSLHRITLSTSKTDTRHLCSHSFISI